jgi:Ca2+-binding RTX toxin-like protein
MIPFQFGTGERQSAMTQAYRNVDGTNNNPLDPSVGQAQGTLHRILDPDYGDGISSLAGALRPSARQISNDVYDQNGSIPNAAGYSDFLWIWGQFLDHDISLTKTSASEDEEAPIPVPAGDPFFDPTNSGMETIGFSRSVFDPATGTDAANPRQQINDITPFIDASNVYGSNAVRALALRAEDGRMKVSDGELLPFNVDGMPYAMGSSPTMFVAGDERANENVALSSMQTLFVREHNRLVTEFEQANPDWDAETLYQEARRIVEAEIQAITYNEFLPKLLGHDALDEYDGYDATISPQIANVFSTAAYRLGHTMLSSTIYRFDEDGSENSFGHLSLRDAFFQPDRLVSEGGIDAILRGGGAGKAEAIDAKIIDDVRNFLFGPPGAGGFDLVSLNLQRGRDHGLDDYNSMREAYGLARVSTFAEITSDVALQNTLESLFGTVDNIDVYVGGLSEDAKPGSQLGELFHTALVEQFTRLRDGDAFWHESRLHADEVAMIRSTTLSDIIEWNSGVETMQDDVFKALTRLVGTKEDDFLLAGDDAELVLGLDGKDTMIASSSAGEMHGGGGNDILYGMEADDWLVGDDDDDQLHGEAGKDHLYGGAGNDFIHAGMGDDTIDGGADDDYIVTGSGADRVFFSTGADVVDDFDVLNDVIDFSHFASISSTNDLTINSFPSGTLLTGPDGDSLWLINVTSSADIAMDFGPLVHEYSGPDQSVLAGTAGDDIFNNSDGTQYIFAHLGVDTIKVDGSRADYTVAPTLDNTGYVMWSDTEVDLLWDMERIEFVDDTLDLDPVV